MADLLTIKTDVYSRLNLLAAKMSGMEPALEQIGIAGVREIVLNFRAGGRPTPWTKSRFNTGKPLSGTGSAGLSGSVTYQVKARSVLVGSNRKHGRLHHFGGIIRPKNVKALPVPLNKQAAKAQSQVKSIRDIPDLALIPRKGKLPILVKFKGRKLKSGAYSLKGASLEPWFVLVKSVTMPARPWLIFSEKAYKRFNNIVRDHVMAKK